jgi:hypothetical protein
MASLSRLSQTTVPQTLFIALALAFSAHAQGRLEKVAVNLHKTGLSNPRRRSQIPAR